jgi:hypothetical protein
VASRIGISAGGRHRRSAHERLHLFARDLAVAIGVHVVEDPAMRLLELFTRQGAVAIGVHDREHGPHHARPSCPRGPR